MSLWVRLSFPSKQQDVSLFKQSRSPLTGRNDRNRRAFVSSVTFKAHFAPAPVRVLQCHMECLVAYQHESVLKSSLRFLLTCSPPARSHTTRPYDTDAHWPDIRSCLKLCT